MKESLVVLILKVKQISFFNNLVQLACATRCLKSSPKFLLIESSQCSTSLFFLIRLRFSQKGGLEKFNFGQEIVHILRKLKDDNGLVGIKINMSIRLS